jgi:hypothetical protein
MLSFADDLIPGAGIKTLSLSMCFSIDYPAQQIAEPEHPQLFFYPFVNFP